MSTSFRQLSFAKGELTPSLYARVDTAAYAAGLRTCRNFMILKSGGAANRPGTQYLGAAKFSTKKCRLIDFIFNDANAYVLEFGNLYVRFWTQGVRMETSTPAAWSNLTSYGVGSAVSRLGVTYYGIQANSNKQPPNATYWYPLTGNILELPTPYTEAELDLISYSQSADTLTLAHKNHPVQALKRSGSTVWSLSNVVFGPLIQPPVNIGNSTGGTTASPAIQVSYAVTAVSVDGEESLPTVVASPGSGISPTTTSPILVPFGFPFLGVTDHFKIYKSVNQSVYGLAGTATLSPFTDSDIAADYQDGPPTDPHVFASGGDYPGAVLYAQQSLFLGGTTNDPAKIWKSHVGFPNDFLLKIPITDAEPAAFTLVGHQVNEIRHLLEVRQLVAFTAGSEIAVNGDAAGIITPTAINSKQQSANGASTVRPVIIGTSILFVQARGSQVRQLGYNFYRNSYDGQDISIFSSHLFSGHTITAWAHQKVPQPIIWAVRDDGVLLGLTYLEEQQMLAWHRHDFDGTVESVCVIPEGNEDRVYLVINRTINNQTVRYVERLASREYSDVKNAIFMDAAVTSDGQVLQTTITGLSHLEGKQVSVLADGYVVASPNNPSYPIKTVVGGQITLSQAAFTVQVGLPVTADLETLDIDVAQGQTLMDKRKNISRITLYLEASRGLFVGASEPVSSPIDGLSEVQQRNVLGAYTSVPDLITGPVDVNVAPSWNSNGRVFLRQIDPIGATILAVVPSGRIGGL